MDYADRGNRFAAAVREHLGGGVTVTTPTGTSGRPASPARARRGLPAAARRPPSPVVAAAVFIAESSNDFPLLGTTFFLVLFGLVMVLSSSSIDSYAETQGFFGVSLGRACSRSSACR